LTFGLSQSPLLGMVFTLILRHRFMPIAVSSRDPYSQTTTIAAIIPA
jgi:hypothetical protein